MADKWTRGTKGKLLLLFEDAFKTLPGSPVGITVPALSDSVKGGRSLQDKATLTGKRAPGKPFEGNMDVSGALDVPLNVFILGWILKALFGAPTTTAWSGLILDAAAAVNKGSGKVGLPCTAHGLTSGQTVTVDGSTNYDGSYMLDEDTSTNELVIVATYASETFVGTETVVRGAVLTLDAGAAVDKGGSKVGLPCTAHGLLPGEMITIADTTNYDGTVAVDSTSTADEIVIASSYSAESFTGAETVTPKVYKHVFIMGDTQPSFALERMYDLDAGAGDKYWVYGGCKASSINFRVGDDGQLTASLGVMGSTKSNNAATVAASVVEYGDHDFMNFDGVILEAGVKLGDVTGFAIDMDMGLDGSAYTIGGRGTRGDIAEGQPRLGGSLTAMFRNDNLLQKAEASTSTSVEIRLASGAHEVRWAYSEILFEKNDPGLPGPQGLMVELPLKGYQDQSTTPVTVTLYNTIATYA